jgi:hypothetical protein
MITPLKGDILEAPSWVSASERDIDVSSIPFSKAYSEHGRFVLI